MQMSNGKTVELSDVMSVVEIALTNAQIATVNITEDYEKYNAVVGTTFNDESWYDVTHDITGLTYLYAHLPVDAKTVFESDGIQSEETLITDQL